jgi:hypothetical protein
VKITPIAAASLIPATIAGVVFSIVPFATGTPAAAAAHVHAGTAVHSVTHVPAAPQPAHGTAQHAAALPAAAPSPALPQPAAPQPAAPQPAAPQPAAPQMSAAEASFEQCVAWRESGDNPTASSAGMFGILPSVWAQLGYPGTADQASVAQQLIAFHRLYLEYGNQPWTPSDGC